MFEFLSITFLIMLAAISPGPDFALTVRNSLYSREVGTLTALGITAGLLVHASYCILGFALVISKSILLFNVIKYLGASYLIYLGIKGLMTKKSDLNLAVENDGKKRITLFQAFSQGFLCNVLNPKAVLFFLAFFTLIIQPSMPLKVEIGYAFEIALIHFIWFSILAYLFSHHRIKASLGRVQYYITKALGGFLVLFGLRIAFLAHE